jgi:hypothetical protein
MATNYAILRSHLLAYIKRTPEGDFDVLGTLRQYLENHGLTLGDDDLCTVEQILHEFYHEGIIVPGPKIKAKFTMQGGTLLFPGYHTTAYGHKALAETDYQPHDPTGYLEKFRVDVPTVDPVIIRYLEECLTCFRHNLLLSAAVTLGCAAEKAVLLLIESFTDTLAGTDQTDFERETNTFIISRKYRALWSRLEPMAKTLPDGLGTNLESVIHNTFDIIRTTRNDAGHPSTGLIEKDAVHANLLLFPIFCKRIYKLIDHFSAE